jgi:hypothetical protein
VRRLLALFALLVCALVVAPGAAAVDTPCIGTLPAGTYDNVIVPPMLSCVLGSGVLVRGNVKALQDSRLHIGSSNVRGNVLGEKADTVELSGTRVRQNIIIREGGPAPSPAPPGFFSTCFTTGNPCEAFVGSTTVEEGSIQIEKMQGGVVVQVSGVLNPIRGNVQIKENVVPAVEGVYVVGNWVEQNIQVEDNFVRAVRPPGAFHGLTVQDNRVDQNLQVYKNRGPGTKSVTGNTVRESLQCFDNDLPFVGSPNTAREAQGQCGAP